ncbi:hypothetical protein [Longimicrobium terrae]|uniref:Uncharacterized protein n=1 Tax=Longimicrobium terrae TaxID=1639882 RepID=A0A841GX17_9BACT|nr:hypothetical protein [Longimicrobium terrae]MBB4635691.1 hypothetical protein [Longimicrobium terrae]MBB6070085.1 hypothetical protein [Longimicrobium terrae]NNC32988.1 hypothetical protein [Longimicrobium terrae]
MGILGHVLLEFVCWLAAEAAGEVLRDPLDRLFAPLGRALRSPAGGRVLLVVWLVSVGWFWLGWKMGTTGDGGFQMAFAVISVFGSAALAMLSTLVWRDRNHAPPRWFRRSAY